MENNPTAPSPESQTQHTPDNGVWISKEEYERLRDAEVATMAVSAIGSGPTESFPNQPVAESLKPTKDFWTYGGGVIAVLVFLGLTLNTGSIFTVPLVIGLIIFSFLAIKTLIKPKSVDSIAPSASYAPAPKSSASKIVGIILLLVLLVPVAPFVLMILMLIFLASTGQASGS